MHATALRTTLFAVLACGVSANASAQRSLSRYPLTTVVRISDDSAARHGASADSSVRHDSAAIAPVAPVAPAMISLRPSRSPKVFFGLMAAGVTAVRAFHLDSDPGGYKDGMRTYTDFPDKGVHALAAWALTNAGVDMKLSPWKSAATVVGAGVGYEFAQGYVSKYDIAADAIGAVSAAAWRHWRASR